MKVAFLTASTSRSAGGLFSTITSYTKALKAIGCDVCVVGFDDVFSIDDRCAFGEVEVFNYSVTRLPFLSTLGYSTDLMGILERINPDILHLQGLWMYHSWAALKYRKRHPLVKVIVEPHGMLDPWALKNSSWKKRIVGSLFEYENLRKADLFHALCESEKDSIAKFGLCNSVAVIPNGIDLPQPKILSEKQSKGGTLIYIGRIHPKKGLKHLIEGIAIIKGNTPSLLEGWQVKIAGWNQLGHQEYLKNLAHQLNVTDIVQFIGPVFGEHKDKLLSEADAFILPSYSEGLPMSVLEAWAYKLPVLMTDYCNLPEGFKAGVALRIEPDGKSIADGLSKILCLEPSTAKEMGERAYSLVMDKFTWARIAERTMEVYRGLIDGGEKPGFVYTD